MSRTHRSPAAREHGDLVVTATSIAAPYSHRAEESADGSAPVFKAPRRIRIRVPHFDRWIGATSPRPRPHTAQARRARDGATAACLSEDRAQRALVRPAQRQRVRDAEDVVGRLHRPRGVPLRRGSARRRPPLPRRHDGKRHRHARTGDWGTLSGTWSICAGSGSPRSPVRPPSTDDSVTVHWNGGPPRPDSPVTEDVFD